MHGSSRTSLVYSFVNESLLLLLLLVLFLLLLLLASHDETPIAIMNSAGTTGIYV